MRGTRTDGACCDNAEDGGEDGRNEKKDGKEQGEEDGKEQEKKEEQRKEDKPTGEEGKNSLGFTKNHFQPASNKLYNCRAQPVAETLQGGEDSSGKETAIPCCLLGGWLCFNDSEQQDNAKGEHNKEGETDNINEGDGENDEKGEEGVGGTIDTRISEMRDTSCEFFNILPTPVDNVTKGQIDISIFLTKNIQIIFNKLSTVLTC